MPAGGRQTHRDERSEETRRQILAAARALFMRHGYRAVSTRQVAEACGLTQPAMYHYFGGKQDLYVAVLQDELNRVGPELARIARRTDPPVVLLEQAARVLVRHTDYELAMMLHDIRAELSQENREAVNGAFMRAFVEPLLAIMRAALVQGDIVPPEQVQMQLPRVVMYFLHQVAFVLPSSPADTSVPVPTVRLSVEERARLALRLFLSGVGQPGIDST